MGEDPKKKTRSPDTILDHYDCIERIQIDDEMLAK